MNGHIISTMDGKRMMLLDEAGQCVRTFANINAVAKHVAKQQGHMGAIVTYRGVRGRQVYIPDAGYVEVVPRPPSSVDRGIANAQAAHTQLRHWRR